MEALRRRARVLFVAVLAGSGVGLLGITQAHALGGRPAGAVSIHWVLGGAGEPAVVRAELTLERPARTVSIRLGDVGWVRCRVHGLHAACPLSSRSVDPARLGRVDVVAST